MLCDQISFKVKYVLIYLHMAFPLENQLGKVYNFNKIIIRLTTESDCAPPQNLSLLSNQAAG